MHPYLTRLGVRMEVQQFFTTFYTSDIEGNLCFAYGDHIEHYGFGFHRIPVSPDLWVAGNLNFSQVNKVIICGSALDAVAWLNKKAAYLSQTQQLLFISTGASLQTKHIAWINERLRKKQFYISYANDLTGQLSALKLAAGLRRLSLDVYVREEYKIQIAFRSKLFSFSQENFSIHAFQEKVKFRFGFRFDRPSIYLSFSDELKANAF